MCRLIRNVFLKSIEQKAREACLIRSLNKYLTVNRHQSILIHLFFNSLLYLDLGDLICDNLLFIIYYTCVDCQKK